MASYPPTQKNYGWQAMVAQQNFIRPRETQGRENLVSKLEALALDQSATSSRMNAPSPSRPVSYTGATMHQPHPPPQPLQPMQPFQLQQHPAPQPGPNIIASAQRSPSKPSHQAAVPSSGTPHMIKCGVCGLEMPRAWSFVEWLNHCAHGRVFDSHEIDYDICWCDVAFMTARELEDHLREYGCKTRR